jgi:hypothetical protein
MPSPYGARPRTDAMPVWVLIWYGLPLLSRRARVYMWHQRLLGRPANARLGKTMVGPTSFVPTEALGCALASLGSDAEVALSSGSGGRGGSGSLRTC